MSIINFSELKTPTQMHNERQAKEHREAQERKAERIRIHELNNPRRIKLANDYKTTMEQISLRQGRTMRLQALKNPEYFTKE